MLLSGLSCGALAGMTESDVADMVSYFLGAFGLGMALSVILRVFRRAAGLAR